MRWVIKAFEIIEKMAKTEGDADLEKIEEILEESLEKAAKFSVNDIRLGDVRRSRSLWGWSLGRARLGRST